MAQCLRVIVTHKTFAHAQTHLNGTRTLACAHAQLHYLSMDRFANMLAVGNKGLVYSIVREVSDS